MSKLKKDEWYVVEYCERDSEIEKQKFLFTKNAMEAVLISSYCANCQGYVARFDPETNMITEIEKD